MAKTLTEQDIAPLWDAEDVTNGYMPKWSHVAPDWQQLILRVCAALLREEQGR